MKIYRLLLFVLLLSACKTTAPIVAPSVVIRDSMSITYKQGKEPTPNPSLKGRESNLICVIKESEQKQPCQSETLTSCEAHSTGKACALATRNRKGEAIAMAANSPQGVRNSEQCERAGDLLIRVDTVFVERWHTQILQPEGRSYSESGPSGEAGLSAKRSQFYKRCTWGFFLLILLFFGRLAFRIIKAIYFKR